MKDIRTASVVASTLVAASTLLTWVTISAPLVGTISRSAWDLGTSDALTVVLLAALLAGFGASRKRALVLIGCALIGATLLGERLYYGETIASAKASAAQDGGLFGSAIANAVTLSMGLGFWLAVVSVGTLAAAVLFRWVRVEPIND